MILLRGPSGRQTGFTLLEMLVVLVVLGVLVVGLSQGVRAGFALWDAQTRRIGETGELDAGARVLRILLSGISAPPPRVVVDPDAAVPTESAGRPASLTFIGDMPTGLGTSRRANITLELRDGRLVLRWTPHRHEQTTAPAPEPIETELIRGVERLDLAYWGSPSEGEAAAWQTQWDRHEIPSLIRVRLAFAKGDRRRWPDLIAAPQR
jgi:general secretion pathway protein J